MKNQTITSEERIAEIAIKYVSPLIAIAGGLATYLININHLQIW